MDGRACPVRLVGDGSREWLADLAAFVQPAKPGGG